MIALLLAGLCSLSAFLLLWLWIRYVQLGAHHRREAAEMLRHIRRLNV
jgi:hypothetical protein